MTATKKRLSRPWPRQPSILFAPLAWLKLQYFCHAGDTEISGFAITARDDPLYVTDFVTIRQHTSAMTVVLDDQAVADFMDQCVDQGLPLQNALRIWIHTHPGSSVDPSGVDEETFSRVFGSCDWAVMLILGRTGSVYVRLSMHVGPGADVQLPYAVDWSAWPRLVGDPAFSLAHSFAQWRDEFAANILPIPKTIVVPPPSPIESSKLNSLVQAPFSEVWEWSELDQEL